MAAWDAETILRTLDECCDAFTFPMLDNGYIYPAAARLSLFRSQEDWGIVIETFGYSPRHGFPSVVVSTFASALRNRREVADFVSRDAFDQYLSNHPHDQSRDFFPLGASEYQDPEDDELVGLDAHGILLRGEPVALPAADSYEHMGIKLTSPPRVAVFELCRALAYIRRSDVLGTVDERRASVPKELAEILVLDDWCHPDVVLDTARPSNSETFCLLARVLETGDTALYQPTEAPNTHWSNWPDGGSL